MSTQNLRRDARMDVRVPVVLIRGKKQIALETSDVSFRGIFVVTTESSQVRALVRLRVELPDHRFEVHAMVVHVVNNVEAGRHGVGLQFWGLSGHDRNAWESFIRDQINQRREAAKRAAAAPVSSRTPHPAASEPMTPSGVRRVSEPDSDTPPSKLGS